MCLYTMATINEDTAMTDTMVHILPILNIYMNIYGPSRTYTEYVYTYCNNYSKSIL